MKPKALWEISITTSREAEDAVVALLERVFGQSASSYSPEEQLISVATVYSSQPRQSVLARRAELESELQFLSRCGLKIEPGKLVIRKVPREDWTTSWKRYFKTIEIGSRLLIRPSWSKRQPLPAQAVVTLDPGLSFGTGQHPTTSFCLKQLVAARKTGHLQSFLDIGTGSGILAISAVKLGYAPVLAFDNDPTAVRVAKTNATKNRVQAKLRIVRQDLARLTPGKGRLYDVICANLIQDLLLRERDWIVSRLRPRGRLVLAGLLVSQFDPVDVAYRERGLKLQTVRAQGEWKSGAFIRSS